MNGPLDITRHRRVINDPNATIAAKIAVAAELWELINLATATLEPFKAEVRSIATPMGQPTVTLNGDGMTQCRVVLPGPTLKLNEGLDETQERLTLGEWFSPIYEVRLQLRSPNPNQFTTFPPWVGAHMATITTLTPSTPRVSLRHLLGVEEIR